MRRVLILFLDHTSYIYLLLLYFIPTFILAHKVEIQENSDSIPLVFENVVFIDENTTFYIVENTIISDFEIKKINKQAVVVKKKKTKKKYSQVNFKQSDNLQFKKNTKNYLFIPVFKNVRLCYLPYKESTFFHENKSILLGVSQLNYSGSSIFYSSFVNNNNEINAPLKLLTYEYFYCDYSICLSHLKIRSPSFLSS